MFTGQIKWLTKYKYRRTAVVAEWLRRLTRNQFPSGSVGSNPTDCENFFVCVNYDIWKMLSATVSNSTFAIQHRWFSGRMLACHAGGPGSIPGRCRVFYAWNWKIIEKIAV